MSLEWALLLLVMAALTAAGWRIGTTLKTIARGFAAAEARRLDRARSEIFEGLKGILGHELARKVAATSDGTEFSAQPTWMDAVKDRLRRPDGTLDADPRAIREAMEAELPWLKAAPGHRDE